MTNVELPPEGTDMLAGAFGSRTMASSFAGTVNPVPVRINTSWPEKELSPRVSWIVFLPGTAAPQKISVSFVSPGPIITGCGGIVLSEVKPATGGENEAVIIVNVPAPVFLNTTSVSPLSEPVLTPTADGPRSIGDGGVVVSWPWHKRPVNRTNKSVKTTLKLRCIILFLNNNI
jgi:hypothetical protein